MQMEEACIRKVCDFRPSPITELAECGSDENQSLFANPVCIACAPLLLPPIARGGGCIVPSSALLISQSEEPHWQPDVEPEK